MGQRKDKRTSGRVGSKDTYEKGFRPPRGAVGQMRSVQPIIERLKDEVRAQQLEAKREMEELRKHRGIFGISTSTG